MRANPSRVSSRPTTWPRRAWLTTSLSGSGAEYMFSTASSTTACRVAAASVPPAMADDVPSSAAIAAQPAARAAPASRARIMSLLVTPPSSDTRSRRSIAARISAAGMLAALRHGPLDLRLRHVFRIARGASEVRHNLILEAEAEGGVGLGEAAPILRYGEDYASAARAVDEMAARL